MSKLYAIEVEIDGQTIPLPPLAYEYVNAVCEELELLCIAWHRGHKHAGSAENCKLAPCARINALLARWREVEA